MVTLALPLAACANILPPFLLDPIKSCISLCKFTVLNQVIIWEMHPETIFQICTEVAHPTCVPCVNLFTQRSGGKYGTEEFYSPIKTYYQGAAINFSGTNEPRVLAVPQHPELFRLPARQLEMWKSARRLHHDFHLRHGDDNFNKQLSCRSHLPTFLFPAQLKQQPLIPI